MARVRALLPGLQERLRPRIALGQRQARRPGAAAGRREQQGDEERRAAHRYRSSRLRFSNLCISSGCSLSRGSSRMRLLEPVERLPLLVEQQVGVAEVLGDHRVAAREPVGALQVLERRIQVLLRVPRPALPHQRLGAHVVDPAEAVDDVAVVGPQLDGARDHALGLVEVDALLRPGVADEVERARVVGILLEREAHVLDRLVRALGLAVEHPDAVEQLVVVRAPSRAGP